MMRSWITLIEDAQYSGSWIEPSGFVHSCDHETESHHGDIAADIFDISPNDDGKHDEYSRGEAIEAAQSEGWIQISYWSDSLSITWLGKATSQQIKETNAALDQVAHAKHFALQHNQTYFDTTDFYEFAIRLKRELRL